MDERSRHALYLRLEELLGVDAAGTLMEHLPPVGWADLATRRDLVSEIATLRSDLSSEIATLRSDAATLRSDLSSETATLRSDVAGIRVEMRAMEQSLTGLFRMELAQAVSSQTRMLVVTMITLFVTGMSLALTVARLG